jgi:hypothetical protein
VDSIDAKGSDPFVIMGKLLALVLDQPWHANLVDCEVIWPDEPPPASAQEEAALPEDSPWNSGIELHGMGDADSALDFIEEFVAFARRAKQTGELIYCLSCV